MVKTISFGSAVGTRSGAMFINMAAAPGTLGVNGEATKAIKPTIPEDRMKFMPWAYWGTNNLLPQEMIRDIETCGQLNAIIEGKARFAICEGIVPAIVKTDNTGKKHVEKILDSGEVPDFLEMNNHFFQTHGWMKDQIGIGNGMGRLMLNGGKDKVALFQRDDVTETRYEKKDPATGKIKNIYYSAEWDKVTGDKDNRIFKIPLLDVNNQVKDLQDKAASGIVEHSISFRYPGWGKHYYSIPLWYAQYKWVKIAQGVPEMKAALFTNSMQPMYLVTIYEQYWQNAYSDWDDFDDTKREEAWKVLCDDIDSCLVGAKNANKTIYVGGKISIDGKEQPFIKIELIQGNKMDGAYLPDSAAANSEIAFGMLWNNAIQGGNQKNDLYSENTGGSNVREATMMQTIIHHPERCNIIHLMTIIKLFNKWNITYPGLDFIIPATVLTTTDTGAGSKPILTGGNNPQNNNGNGNNPNSN